MLYSRFFHCLKKYRCRNNLPIVPTTCATVYHDSHSKEGKKLKDSAESFGFAVK